MRFWVATAVAAAMVMGISVNGTAQGKNQFNKKPASSGSKNLPESTHGMNATTPATSSTDRELKNLERQSAQAKTPHSRAAKKQAPALKPAQAHQKANPPINFGGGGGGSKSGGMVNQGKNPYKGRLRQKGQGQH